MEGIPQTEQQQLDLARQQLEMNASGPQLVILSQGSVMQDHITRDNFSKQVHVVVKNLAFIVEVGSTVDLTKCSLETKLYYDFNKEEDEKIEVAFVKVKPLHSIIGVTDSGFKASVELRIMVLTSQHEDMLFRVYLSAVDPISGQPFGCWTHPIKVISKLTQIGKREKPVTPTHNSSKKRTSNDMIQSSLTDLQRQLQEQNKWIHLIMHKLFVDIPAQQANQGNAEPLQTLANVIPHPSLQDFATIDEGQAGPTSEEEKRSTGTSELEGSFRNFLMAFNNLPPEEKQAKLDSLLHNVGNEELTDMLEVLDSSPYKKKVKAEKNKE